MHFKSVSVGSLKRMLFAFAVWDQQSEEGFTLRGFSSLRSLGPDEGSNQLPTRLLAGLPRPRSLLSDSRY